MRKVRFCWSTRRYRLAFSIEPATRDAIKPHDAPVLIVKRAQARGLHIDHAHQLAARHHRHGQFAAHGVERDQIARVGADVFDQHRFAALRRRSHDAFAEADHQAAHDLFAVADGIADAQALISFVVQQDGEQIVGNHFLDDVGDVRQQLIQIERLRGDARHFEQEVEQLGALAERFNGFAGSGHGGRGLSRRGLDDLDAGAGADAAGAGRHHFLQVFQRAHSARAFTPIAGPTVRRISATSSTVAPPGPKPVEVFTKSAPAAFASSHAATF